MSFRLRNVQPGDVDAVLDLNESAVPAMNSLVRDDMEWFVANATYFRVVEDDAGIAAFLIGFRAGTAYDCENYHWFGRRLDDFAYIDRVAVAKRARRHGLASMLYDDFAASVAGAVDVVTCEVNLSPPNPGSMAFHERRGFRQVGTRDTDDGQKRVAMMERPL